MEHQVVEVTTREGAGKGAARKLRAKGHIPGVLYGHKEAPQPLALDPIKLKRTLRDSGKIIDSIADKKIVHKNKASRHKSRLSAAVKAMA